MLTHIVEVGSVDLGQTQPLTSLKFSTRKSEKYEMTTVFEILCYAEERTTSVCNLCKALLDVLVLLLKNMLKIECIKRSESNKNKITKTCLVFVK